LSAWLIPGGTVLREDRYHERNPPVSAVKRGPFSLEGRGAVFIGLVSLLLTVGVGILDFISGPELSSAIFYILPIALAGWYGSTRLGFAIAVLASLAWLAADLGWGLRHYHVLIPLWNALVRLGLFLVILLLLSRLRHKLKEEEALADTDQLTGLLNVRAYSEKAEQEIERLERYGRPFSLAYLDLDDFKQVNDRFGHSTGDELLQAVAKILRERTRTVDLVARLGGDEFALLLPEADLLSARMAVHKLQSGILEEMARHGWPVTVSSGILEISSPPESVHAMTTMADQLMYRIKRTTKNGLALGRLDGSDLKFQEVIPDE
jgi:diguanylate cyclase (GGDEF)-like protein